jgi:N-acetyl sugar amidotransferase
MKYCKNCLQPDTRPNIVFSDDGVCPACSYFSALVDVDWSYRVEILKDLLASRKRRSGVRHDCIIGVSGGKDSTRQALWVRDSLKVNPLLVCLSYPPEQVTERGVDNLSNLIELGFDLVMCSPAPGVWRRLKRDGFDEFTNSFRSTELALFSSVPRVALRYGIDLILWGENPALQLGDMRALGKTGFDGNNLRYMNTLTSGKDWMFRRGYRASELIPYTYPTVDEFEAAGLQIVYLGWFLGDWSLVNNASYSCLNGLKIRSDDVDLTGDLFGVTALDEDFTPINQLIKYYKFGFGRTTDYVNEEIRLGRMSREQGISLVTRFDDKCSYDYISVYCDYLEISTDYFWEKVRQSCNTRLFDVRSDGSINRRFVVGVGLQ